MSQSDSRSSSPLVSRRSSSSSTEEGSLHSPPRTRDSPPIPRKEVTGDKKDSTPSRADVRKVRWSFVAYLQLDGKDPPSAPSAQWCSNEASTLCKTFRQYCKCFVFQVEKHSNGRFIWQGYFELFTKRSFEWIHSHFKDTISFKNVYPSVSNPSICWDYAMHPKSRLYGPWSEGSPSPDNMFDPHLNAHPRQTPPVYHDHHRGQYLSPRGSGRGGRFHGHPRHAHYQPSHHPPYGGAVGYYQPGYVAPPPPFQNWEPPEYPVYCDPYDRFRR